MVKNRATRALTLNDNKILPKSKRSQMQLSFGMIFSIILIVIFLAFAFYAIMKFLEMQKTVQIGQFIDDIQNDVNGIRQGLQGSVEKTYSLPSNIDYVCFADFLSPETGENKELYYELQRGFTTGENLFFYPFSSGRGMETKIEKIDLFKTTEKDNPLCFENKKGKVKIALRMQSGETAVTISK